MKKILLPLMVITTIISCSTAPVATTNADKVDVNQSGLNYRSSANIDAIKATNKDMENLDSASYKSKYADTALIYDNGKETNLTENVSFFKFCSDKKVQIKTSVGAIWGSKFNHTDGTRSEYVYQSITLTVKKGDKSVDVLYFQGDEFKDGKIIREYDYYDPTNLRLLMK